MLLVDGVQDNELRENLAEYAHEAWSGWMRYMFSKCEPPRLTPDDKGNVLIPAWSVERWTRQMNTPYTDLPESEKESDRKEADEMLAIMEQRLAAASVDRQEAWEEVQRCHNDYIALETERDQLRQELAAIKASGYSGE